MQIAPQQVDVIVTTYNRPDALRLVLLALAEQTLQGFRVIVADDGSTPETSTLIGQLKSELPYVLRHIWQADQGFRAAAARNRALAQATGEYVIFIDGDCVPPADFIRNHLCLAQRKRFVAGNRVLCSENFTHRLLAEDWPIWRWSWWHWRRSYLARDINRLLPLLYIPGRLWRLYKAKQWKGAKTCNLAAWRMDLQAINGFDESYQGWGHEDADLVVRLIRYGVLRLEGRFAVPVFHLWHHEQSRVHEMDNFKRLQEIMSQQHSWARQGLDKYSQAVKQNSQSS